MTMILENWQSSMYYNGPPQDLFPYLSTNRDPELVKLQKELAAQLNYYKDYFFEFKYYNRNNIKKYKKTNGG